MLNLFTHYQRSTKASEKWTSYFSIYEQHLARYTRLTDTLVEIGVSTGGSLEMWAAAFPSAQIVGIDLDPRCASLHYTSPNVHVELGDQCDPALWQRVLTTYPSPRIVIDDGGHFMHQQITTFELVFPHLPLDSVYVVEDCHTSYMSAFQGGVGQPQTFIEYAKQYIDLLHLNWIPPQETPRELQYRSTSMEGLSGVYFYDSVVVFEKRGRTSMRVVTTGNNNTPQ